MDGVLEDVDKLIKKHGIVRVLSKVLMRVNYPAVLNQSAKRGAPKTELQKYWNLREAFNHFRLKHPYENREYVANAMIVFLKTYRHRQEKPEIWGKQLAEDKAIFDMISWIGDFGKKNITEKTIVNKLDILKRQDKKNIRKIVSDVFSQMDFSIYPPGWTEGDDLNNY